MCLPSYLCQIARQAGNIPSKKALILTAASWPLHKNFTTVCYNEADLRSMGLFRSRGECDATRMEAPVDAQVETATEAFQETNPASQKVLGTGLSGPSDSGTRRERYSAFVAGLACPLGQPMQCQARTQSLLIAGALGGVALHALTDRRCMAEPSHWDGTAMHDGRPAEGGI